MCWVIRIIAPRRCLLMKPASVSRPAGKFSFDVSTFYNIYQHLVSATAGTPVLAFASGVPYLEIPISTGNQRHGESYGAELSVTWNPTSRWRLTGGYNWLRVETQPYAGDINRDEVRTSPFGHSSSPLASPLLLRSDADHTNRQRALLHRGDGWDEHSPAPARRLRIGWRPNRRSNFPLESRTPLKRITWNTNRRASIRSRKSREIFSAA